MDLEKECQPQMEGKFLLLEDQKAGVKFLFLVNPDTKNK